MKRRWRPFIALCLASLLLACASTARITGDFDEYGSYRQTRIATNLEQKLAASERYLQTYPKGEYAGEVKRWFEPAEKRYFKLSWDHMPRLRAYLSALPRGPHAEAVADRIAELEAVREYANKREQRLLERAQRFEQRLAQAAEQRRVFLRELAQLIRSLGAIRGIGRPLAELDPELLLRFRGSSPPGRCDGDYCVSILRFAYAVPADKILLERSVDLTLEIILAHGLVQRVSLSAPELLTRMAEASRVSAVPAGDLQARAEALGQALDIVSDALAEPLPPAGCSKQPVSPVVLVRQCHHLRLEVSAGTEPAAPDRLRVRAEWRAGR